MYPQLKPSEDQFDHKRETKYCIKSSKLEMESKRKEIFRNKLCFDYSLQKLNKEKYVVYDSDRLYGNVMTYATGAYPSIYSKGQKFCNHMYSSDRVKMTRQRFLSHRYDNFDETFEGLRQDNKKKHRVVQRKNQQGGIDSFWMFKKDPVKEQKKKPKGQQVGQSQKIDQINQEKQENKIQQAYFKLLSYLKIPNQLQNSLVPRNGFSKYIASIFGETFCIWFINFYQFKNYLNYKEFQSMCEKFSNITLRQAHLVSFFLYDDNGDGFICPRDCFSIFQRQLSPKIDEDVLKIGTYVKKNLGKKVLTNEAYKIENICIRDDWLTIKDYEMYFKKVDEPYLKATNKKDTVFSKSFAVLDHRQKVRSKRKQMNQKKNLYEQLYGEISKANKFEANIDTQIDYKLNFSEIVEIFGQNPTELYKYFISTIFGIAKIPLT